MQARRWVAASATMLAVALLLAGCGGSSDSSGSNSGGGGSATTAAAGGGGASDKVSLTAKGIAWDKTTLNLPANTQVTVTVDNQDTVEHNFTMKGAEGAEKDVEGGEKVDVSFKTPAAGSYEFHCEYHPSQMKGTVTVS